MGAPSAVDPVVRHCCGVFGIFGDPSAVADTYIGLLAQQHRGQEGAGICTTDGKDIIRHAGLGLVTQVFNKRVLEQLRNPVAIGHVRYSTTGSCNVANLQPMLVEHMGTQVALAHNGNLINAALIRSEYESLGHIFQTTSDTETIIHLLVRPANPSRHLAISHVLNQLQGAFSLLFLYADCIIAARDPWGIRPLCIGRKANGALVVASETVALDKVDAQYIRDVEPGEIVTLDKKGIQSHFFVDRDETTPAHCIFEQIYFADPSSDVFGENVHVVRKAMGRRLAAEAPVEADAVIPVPNCARCAAMGYAEESGLPLERGFTTNHYTGRSFILPEQDMRDMTVQMKLSVIRPSVAGKRLVVVEDSIVRGTTTRGKMGALRKAGAKEIHLRVASPPIRHPCYFGIDFPEADKLVANLRSIEEIRDFLEVDSLHYLSVDGMLQCVKHAPSHYCTACFSGKYPMPVDRPVSKFALERRQLHMFE
jgi:amidophosphoribosyltransferase